ncbi:MAG: RDD family protein [Pyrinomonadaceae bacterium]
MNDTVREELQTKITPGIALRPQPRAEAPPAPKLSPPRPAPALPTVPKKTTANLSAPKTSPTLVGFQNKNAPLPEWRLQLQNAVQQRKGGQAQSGDTPRQFSPQSAPAMRSEPVSGGEVETVTEISDLRVAKAMRRIEESRRTFLDSETPAKPDPLHSKVPARPFGVVAPSSPSQNSASGAATAPAFARVSAPAAKPKLVDPVPAMPQQRRDTNKLPKLEQVHAATEPVRVGASTPVVLDETAAEFPEIKRISIRADRSELVEPDTASYADEIEDLAPFSMRFSAGLFDLIIGGFTSLLLLSPIAFSGIEWLSRAGLLTLLGTFSIVMFVYMTACLGFVGKTLGMRLFSLELVDASENEYPTLKQAAVNSCIFLFSIALGGAGFLTVFFNEEKRALHDLLSGTILVREF